MANEIQYSWQANGTSYALVRNTVGQIWSQSGGGGFGSYVSAAYADFVIQSTEQGTSSAYYVANMPSNVPPGVYNVVAKGQVAVSPAETDPTVAVGDIEWTGSGVLPLSNMATSGMVSQFLPVRVTRGNMIRNFQFYLKSAADHITPFTSGICSGQIVRGSGLWGPLQSGAFTEIGQGLFLCQALTSGDLNAETIGLLFSATGVSGGVSDPLVMSFITQRTVSG